ncbi:phage tail protein I [Desulfovibrio sp. SGI.169]|uniref:phage tail protein I n=1 Tax=Desulfovibrio sp. SGI.169 TaxID=3420561 RepID=UPI003CFE20CC
MAKRLGLTPFHELLAHSIAADPTMRAVADALDGVLNAATRAIPNVLLYARLARDTGFVEPVPMLAPLTRLAEQSGGLAELSAELLDLLAWQLHVEGYEAAVNAQAKREMISASLLLHRGRGTPWAVRNGLESALRIPATVSEWFDYGGKPYFFRVRLDVSQSAWGESMAADAVRLIFDNKNVRSWLDCLETATRRPLPVSVALGGVSRTLTRPRLWFPPVTPPPLPIRAAVASRGVTRSGVSPVGPAPRPPRPRRMAGFAAKIITRSALCPMI